jgi:uncharacterized membrane protein
MLDRVRAFGAFWYDFVVGDDWRVAVLVVVALATTYAVSTTSVPAWWVPPVFVAVIIPMSALRVVRRASSSKDR